MSKKSNFLRKRYFVIAIFLILLAGITLGYSALRTTLSINGTTKIDKVGWDIHFENLVINENSVPIGDGNSPATIASNKIRVDYNITLTTPGDFYEFEVDVKNGGTIDAKIESVSNTSLTPEQDAYTNYTIKWKDNNAVPAANDKLAAGAKRTLVVRIEFDTDIEPSDLPENGATFDLSYQQNYVQDR